MNIELTGKVALITGASRGIGQAIAELFAASGAQVIISSRKQDGLDKVAERIRANGGAVETEVCHNGEAASREALIKAIKDRHGRLDVLINNAAANPYFGHILDTPEAAMRKTIEVNIEGYFHMSQLAGRLMKTHGGGSIINTASVNGRVAGFNQGIYSVSKAAIISLTEAFAKECARHNIRVNAVLPGLTDTQFAAALTQNEQMLNMILPQIPMNRVAKPREIAGIYAFLASDHASYMTGTSIPVDGGYLC